MDLSKLEKIKESFTSDDQSERCRCELLSDRVVLALIEVAKNAQFSSSGDPDVGVALCELSDALEGKPVECPTCKGAASFTEDKWSYGDSRGRGEGHYTIDHDCPCCDGEGSFKSPQEAEEHKGHDGSEHEPDSGEPPEPDTDDRDHVKEDED